MTNEELTMTILKSLEAIKKGIQSNELLDHITNLQKENEILKENAIHNDKIVDKARWNETIYKSRIDNAIEFIETNPLIWNPNMELTKLIGNPELKDRLYYTPDEWLHKLHTILKGDEKNVRILWL